MRNDWIEAIIEDFIGFKGVFCDGDWVESKDQDPNGEIRLIQLADIGDGNFRNKSNRFLTKQKSIELKCTYLKKGDILVARMPDPLGRACLFPLEGNKKFVTVVDVCIIRIESTIIINKYLLYCINSPIIRVRIEEFKSGSTRKRISRKNFAKINFPIPPLPEQRAIVAKIEQLFSDLDNGIANLKTAQEQLKVYRQAVLKKAFEGELTKEWREKQTNLPTADELLEQIKTEREAYYKKQLDEWQKKVKEWESNGKEGKKPSKPKKIKNLSRLTEIELKELTEISDQWSWVKIDKIIEHNYNSLKAGPFGSSLKKSFYVKNGYKIYGQEQVISGDPFFGNYYINEEKYKELKSCQIKTKDILISLVGTVGKVLILPDDCKQGVINPRLIKISLNKIKYFPLFFKYYFESSFLKNIYKVHAHGATMDIITMGIIKILPFPLCSLEEQKQIVQEIELRLSVCDKLDETINNSLEKAEALRQSILKKAFEGKLLTDQELEACQKEPDWESAEQLLKWIKAERLKKEG